MQLIDHLSINIVFDEQVINLLLEMKTIGENNMTFLESEFKDVRSYTKLILFVLLYVTLIIVYTLWIIAIPLKIKTRMRKCKQLKENLLASREEEERQKWDLYNEKTHIVKESYLLAICICEFCFTLLELSVQRYVILQYHLDKFHNTTLPEYTCFLGELTIISYEEPIVILLRVFPWIFIHIILLLVCSLMRYLIDIYLFRKTYNRLTIIVYGVLSSVFIMLFFNDYTFHFRIIATLIFIVDLFLLLRYRKHLSLVLIGRVREIQQCYGNNWKYKYEYRKYVSFRGYSFLFYLGTVLSILGNMMRLIFELFTNYIFPCIGIHIDISNSSFLSVVFNVLHHFSDVPSVIGQVIIFTPCFIYTFYLLVSGCVKRFTKQPSFHDEIIRPLIERYHDEIVN